MKIIGVDVDLTVVDVVYGENGWLKWYHDLTGHNLEQEISTDNNDIERYMKAHDDPMAFWRKHDLYDKHSVYPDAVDVLTDLYINHGVKIVFVSACYPEHETSKRMLIRRSFPFEHGFVSTRDKGFVKMDYFIDDYKKYLQHVKDAQPECKVFQIKSSLNKPAGFPFGDWYDFKEMILADLYPEKEKTFDPKNPFDL